LAWIIRSLLFFERGTTSVVMIVGRSSKTVSFVATLALTTFGALATASAPTPREAAPSGTTVMRRTPTTQQPAAPPAAPDVNSRGPLRGLQVGAEPAIAASPKPWPLSDRSGGEPIPNALAYAAQPTPSDRSYVADGVRNAAGGIDGPAGPGGHAHRGRMFL
jgi:hypothetical protein